MIHDTDYSTEKSKKKSRKQISYLIATLWKRKKQKEISQVASIHEGIRDTDYSHEKSKKEIPQAVSFA